MDSLKYYSLLACSDLLYFEQALIWLSKLNLCEELVNYISDLIYIKENYTNLFICYKWAECETIPPYKDFLLIKTKTSKESKLLHLIGEELLWNIPVHELQIYFQKIEETGAMYIILQHIALSIYPYLTNCISFLKSLNITSSTVIHLIFEVCEVSSIVELSHELNWGKEHLDIILYRCPRSEFENLAINFEILPKSKQMYILRNAHLWSLRKLVYEKDLDSWQVEFLARRCSKLLKLGTIIGSENIKNHVILLSRIVRLCDLPWLCIHCKQNFPVIAYAECIKRSPRPILRQILIWMQYVPEQLKLATIDRLTPFDFNLFPLLESSGSLIREKLTEKVNELKLFIKK